MTHEEMVGVVIGKPAKTTMAKAFRKALGLPLHVITSPNVYMDGSRSEDLRALMNQRIGALDRAGKQWP